MTRRKLLLTLTLTSFLAASANQAFGQMTPAAGDRVPAGNWKVTLSPYTGPDVEAMPLQVISVVGTPGGKSIWIRERRLLNRSDKAVVKASFTAFVYNVESPETLLFRRTLNTVSFAGVPIRAGAEWPPSCPEPPKYCPYGHALPGVEQLLAPLIKDATLEGAYRIEIGVSKVEFDDGSTWEFQESQPRSRQQSHRR